jgi:hypothetical protein
MNSSDTQSIAQRLAFPAILFIASATGLVAQATQVRVTPAKLTMNIGDEIELKTEVLDVGGRPVDQEVFFFTRARGSVSVDKNGMVKALKSGEFSVVVRVAGQRRRRGGVSAIVPVTVLVPTPASITFRGIPKKIYANTTIPLRTVVLDEKKRVRPDLTPTLASSNRAIAVIDAFGNLTARRTGRCEITAKSAGLTTKITLDIVANPIRELEIEAEETEVRTGDVVHFQPRSKDANGKVTVGVPIHLSFYAKQKDDLGPGASGQIEQDGRFVAETPGIYTIVATCGNVVARRTLKVVKRNVQMRVKVLGHGEVLDVHTSDLWVWEGIDGRDYAVTGTWGANGEAIFWDVTDPEEMTEISRVKVDARTVNDVKVSKDGRICIISREGASNRKNGMILLDVTNPRSPKRLSTFTENLTGGVHNLFIDKGYAYALSAGRRYDVIDIKDPEAPFRVASYEVNTPSHSIHDVWVQDGIAYSSNWRNGLHLVDVGNGIKGGSPTNPVKIASYTYPSGRNHAAFPYKSKSTGKFYVIAGDEAFPFGLSTREKPTYPRGWFHFVDFTDLDNPREVARYQVPEAGTHNLWVEGDILYGAYYNAGIRIVDISGELMGDLYRQGREIAFFVPTHHKGVVPNAAMTWGPQPHKGNIFFTDWNSGLWCVKLVPQRRRRR